MTQQPLSNVRSGASVEFGPGKLSQHPKLCSLVMDIVSLGAQIENSWSNIIVGLMGAEHKAGAAMYMALSGGASRRAALHGAACAVLPPADYMVVRAVEKATNGVRAIRNDFVHHIWAISSDLPDALLLINPSAIQEVHSNLADLIHNSNKDPDANTGRLDLSKVMVWREGDLLEQQALANWAVRVMMHLDVGLMQGGKMKQMQPAFRTFLMDDAKVAEAYKKISAKS